MSEEKKVPAIRFKGFTDDWEQRKFGEFFDFMNNNTLSRDELNYENGAVRNVHYGDVLIKFDELLDASADVLPYITEVNKASKAAQDNLINGDIVIADTAEDETVGKCTEITNVNDSIIVAGLHTMPCRPCQKFGCGYLGFYMNAGAYHDQLRPLMQGIKVISVSRSAIANTMISYPTDIAEQEKIGNFFRNLDNAITLHQRKLEKLKIVKKSMLEKMFPKNGAKAPEIRFAGFTDDWEQRKLGDVVSRYEDPVETPHDGYMRLGIRSHAKGTFHDYVEPGHELETAQMHRVAADKLIFNITFAWEHAVAITDIDDEGMLVSHRFPQFTLSDCLRPEFLKYEILDERFHHHLWLSSPGGAGRNRVLKIDEALNYGFSIPSVEEQEKVGKFLLHLDNLITLHQRKLEKLWTIKKSMLEKMFV